MPVVSIDVLWYWIQCLARSWGKMSHHGLSKLLVLSFPLGRVSSGTKAAVLEAPSWSFLAGPQVMGLDTRHPGLHFPHQPLLSPYCCFRTPRSATTQPPTSPRSVSSSTVCHARCCSSSRPMTYCEASRPPWAPVPVPAPSSTCHVAVSERWPRECGLRPLLPSSSLAYPRSPAHLHFLLEAPRALPQCLNLQVSLQGVRG